MSNRTLKVNDEIWRLLEERAKRNGVSMEDAARAILLGALLRDGNLEKGLGTQIAELFRNIPDNDEPFELLPREDLKPIKFD